MLLLHTWRIALCRPRFGVIFCLVLVILETVDAVVNFRSIRLSRDFAEGAYTSRIWQVLRYSSERLSEYVTRLLEYVTCWLMKILRGNQSIVVLVCSHCLVMSNLFSSVMPRPDADCFFFFFFFLLLQLCFIVCASLRKPSLSLCGTSGKSKPAGITLNF